jgi:hypothetical protein
MKYLTSMTDKSAVLVFLVFSARTFCDGLAAYASQTCTKGGWVHSTCNGWHYIKFSRPQPYSGIPEAHRDR